MTTTISPEQDNIAPPSTEEITELVKTMEQLAEMPREQLGKRSTHGGVFL